MSEPKHTPKLTKKAALAILKTVPEDRRKTTLCAITRHSRIITSCFGYIYCGRCETQIGDALGGVFDGSKNVIIGHDCETCRKNAETLTWEDALLAADPFPAKEEVEA